MITFVIAYDKFFGEIREHEEGHAILVSSEVDSNSVYIIDLSRHARSQTNSDLIPKQRSKKLSNRLEPIKSLKRWSWRWHDQAVF